MDTATTQAPSATEPTMGEPITLDTNTSTRSDNEPVNAIEALAKRHLEKQGNPELEAAEPEQAEEAQPKPEAKEDDKSLPLRHARALKDLTKAQGELVSLKKQVETLRSFETSTKADFTANPLKALEKLTGRSFAEIMNEATAGKYDHGTNIDPELRAKLDELEKFKNEHKSAQEKAAEQARRTQDLQTINTALAGKDLPLFFAMQGHDDLLDKAYAHLTATGEQPDIEAIASQMEANALEFMQGALTPAALKKLATIPALRTAMQQALGASPAKPAAQPKAQPRLAPLNNQTAQVAPVEATPTKRSRAEQEAADWEDIQKRFQSFKTQNNGRIV